MKMTSVQSGGKNERRFGSPPSIFHNGTLLEQETTFMYLQSHGFVYNTEAYNLSSSLHILLTFALL
jgi:dTDP-4-dehydrorhamnose 3,5-epimerase-like enzyme